MTGVATSPAPEVQVSDAKRAAAVSAPANQWLRQGPLPELLEALQENRVTSAELVDTHIARIQRVNPIINAVVKNRFELARAEAQACDEFIAGGQYDRLPPLYGMPCTIKECFALQGMPNSSGLRRRKNVIASEDAASVQRLRSAGAIPMGVTNTSELCMWLESYNPVYGRTNNPYDPSRIVGGSSGGEGAIVAAGGSPFGLGSDVGGSIRMPAFFNGVFGHKPSPGLVPNQGQYPCGGPQTQQYLATGPLCRSASDIYPLLQVLAGKQDLPKPEGVRLEDLRIIHIAGDGRHGVAADLAKSQIDAFEALQRSGMAGRETSLKLLRHGFDIWSSLLHLADPDDERFSDHMAQGQPFHPWRELGKTLVKRSEYTPMALVLAIAEGLNDKIPARTAKFAKMGEVLRQEFLALLGDDGVILYPSFTRPAPKHDSPLRRQLMLRFEYAYTAVLNAVGLPVTQVPLGLNKEGVPLGVQVVAAPGRDDQAIAVAMELERLFGGWVYPQQL